MSERKSWLRKDESAAAKIPEQLGKQTSRPFLRKDESAAAKTPEQLRELAGLLARGMCPAFVSYI